MNSHLQYLSELHQAAQQFWQDWQQQYPHFQNAEPVDFVKQSNEILQRYLPDVSLELEGMADEKQTLVFTANGVRDYFPDVQTVVQAAPQNLPYTVRAFRHAILANDADELVIGMNGFELGVKDIVFRLDVWQEMPALEIAFSKPIDDEFLVHAKNMTMIILDHFLGEWHSATKIGAIDFLEEAENDLEPLFRLPEKLEQLWQELGRTGIYPQPEWEYATAEAEPDEEQEHLLLTRNQSANALLGRADMTWVVSIACQLNQADDTDAAFDLQDQFNAYANQHQQGIDTLSIMNLSEGVRTVYAVTSMPETLLPQALALCEQFPALNPQTECEYDPTWVHYRF